MLKSERTEMAADEGEGEKRERETPGKERNGGHDSKPRSGTRIRISRLHYSIQIAPTVCVELNKKERELRGKTRQSHNKICFLFFPHRATPALNLLRHDPKVQHIAVLPSWNRDLMIFSVMRWMEFSFCSKTYMANDLNREGRVGRPGAARYCRFVISSANYLAPFSPRLNFLSTLLPLLHLCGCIALRNSNKIPSFSSTHLCIVDWRALVFFKQEQKITLDATLIVAATQRQPQSLSVRIPTQAPMFVCRYTTVPRPWAVFVLLAVIFASSSAMTVDMPQVSVILDIFLNRISFRCVCVITT